MQPKKYIAKSIQEAVTRIKDELGPGALILSTKRVPKGMKDPYGSDLFEVMAVPQEEAEAAPAMENKPASSPEPERVVKRYEVAEDEPQDFSGAEHDHLEKYVKDLISPAAEPPPPVMGGGEIGALREELGTIRDMLTLMHQGEGLSGLIHTHPECLNMYARLIQAGMSDRRAQAFMNKGTAYLNNAKPDAKEIAKRVLGEILASIDVVDPFHISPAERERGKKIIAAFIGPTGVGKTTTIAKLAAELSLKQKRSVGLISIDSYRIAALEQLRTYSSIMGLPCLPAFSYQDLETAVKKMRNKEIILIDTAGISHLDEQRMKEMARLMMGELSISTHLVLSATTSRLDMNEAARSFAVQKPVSYVFTKMDETKRRGAIVDQVMEMKLPISYVANGQRVPEDIVMATKKNILKLIFEGAGQ